MTANKKRKVTTNSRILMNIFIVLCFFLALIQSQEAYAGEKKSLNLKVPLPDDIKIVAPAGDVPKDIAAFSGVWEGEWAYLGTKSALVVEEINFKEAQVILCRKEVSGYYAIPAKCGRYKAIVTPKNLHIRFSVSNNLYIFSMENDLNHIKGIFKTLSGDDQVTMTKSNYMSD